MNKEKEDNGEQIFMNPRNTASGSIKLQDSKEVSKRPLIAFMYGISMKENNFDNHYGFYLNYIFLGRNSRHNNNMCNHNCGA